MVAVRQFENSNFRPSSPKVYSVIYLGRFVSIKVCAVIADFQDMFQANGTHTSVHVHNMTSSSSRYCDSRPGFDTARRYDSNIGLVEEEDQT